MIVNTDGVMEDQYGGTRKENKNPHQFLYFGTNWLEISNCILTVQDKRFKQPIDRDWQFGCDKRRFRFRTQQAKTGVDMIINTSELALTFSLIY